MAAPTLFAGTTLEDGVIGLVWDQVVSAVAGSSALLTIRVINRGITRTFTIDEVEFGAGSTGVNVAEGIPIYAGDIIKMDIGAGFLENESSEPNAAVSDEDVLNRSLTDPPTSTVSFTVYGTGTIDFTGGTPTINFSCGSGNVKLG